MAIKMEGMSIFKYLTPAKMTEILATLPANSRLITNGVGNLAVFSDDSEYIGFIDFASETYELVPVRDDEPGPSLDDSSYEIF